MGFINNISLNMVLSKLLLKYLILLLSVIILCSVLFLFFIFNTVLATKFYLIDWMTLILCLFGLQIVKELQSFRQISGPDPNYNDICFSGAGTYVCYINEEFLSLFHCSLTNSLDLLVFHISVISLNSLRVFLWLIWYLEMVKSTHCHLKTTCSGLVI